ncbi:MAG: hypothetical protein CMO01_15085 [Thalassobius sp.]|nr:hypothetical protein [Thalassovita sp.]
MELLDKITVFHQDEEKQIELYKGDLTAIPQDKAVDVLVISAYPNLYEPDPNSLVKCLLEKNVDVKELAKDKAVDLRQNFSCWLSKDISGQNFKKILCFEPLSRGNPSELVGEIFQSLMPFVFVPPGIKSIAMPLVTSGNQGFAPESILEPLIDAAANWLTMGMPVERISIVEIDEVKSNELLRIFKEIKHKYDQKNSKKQNRIFKYDLFISYSHKNDKEITEIVNMLLKVKPDIKIFLDKKDLDAGAGWQQELYDALDNCRRVIAFLSAPYIDSKVCKEEFNIAVFRHREEEEIEPVLIPVYLYSTELPTYMKLIQFSDCREANLEKLADVCKEIVDSLEK